MRTPVLTWMVALAVLPVTTAATEPTPPTLFLNEVMHDPEGADAGAEWVELWNPGPEPLRLDGWSLTDHDSGFGGGTDALDGLVILPLQALRVDLRNVRLGNAGDDLHLLRPDGSEADGVAYGTKGELPRPPEGATLARDLLHPETWRVSDEPSPGLPNLR